MPPNPPPIDRRAELLDEVQRLAGLAVFGTVSETYRTCGNAGCRCHGPGPKHGPHMYISFRGDAGKTTGYYVPKSAQDDIRRGVEAWQSLQQALRELAEINRLVTLEHAKGKAPL